MGNKVMPNEVLYHIGISAEMIKGAEYALLPGDPGRVEALARALGTAEPVGCHREYKSWLADVEGTSVLVCSTGMGGPSVAIGMEELARLGIKNFIRVGTTGSIQKDVELGDLVINKIVVELALHKERHIITDHLGQEFAGVIDLHLIGTAGLHTGGNPHDRVTHLDRRICSPKYLHTVCFANKVNDTVKGADTTSKGVAQSADKRIIFSR